MTHEPRPKPQGKGRIAPTTRNPTSTTRLSMSSMPKSSKLERDSVRVDLKARLRSPSSCSTGSKQRGPWSRELLCSGQSLLVLRHQSLVDLYRYRRPHWKEHFKTPGAV